MRDDFCRREKQALVNYNTQFISKMNSQKQEITWIKNKISGMSANISQILNNTLKPATDPITTTLSTTNSLEACTNPFKFLTLWLHIKTGPNGSEPFLTRFRYTLSNGYESYFDVLSTKPNKSTSAKAYILNFDPNIVPKFEKLSVQTLAGKDGWEIKVKTQIVTPDEAFNFAQAWYFDSLVVYQGGFWLTDGDGDSPYHRSCLNKKRCELVEGPVWVG